MSFRTAKPGTTDTKKDTVGDCLSGGGLLFWLLVFTPAFQSWCTKSKEHPRFVPSFPEGPRCPN